MFVGVNLLGPEDNDIGLKNYNAQMLLVHYLQKYYNNTIHVSLHAGELSDRLPNVKKQPSVLTYHVNNAIKIAAADRIGHGTDIFTELSYHPSLIDEMKNHSKVVEINLTSNEQILGVCDNEVYCLPPFTPPYRPPVWYKYNHPFYFYLASGVPVVLSTDDQGVEQTSLTEEYYKGSTRYKLTYQQLKDIDRNSLIFSFLPGQQLWATIGDYIHFVPPCANDNPYTDLPPSSGCKMYLNSNLRAQLEWNLEKNFSKFESEIRSVTKSHK